MQTVKIALRRSVRIAKTWRSKGEKVELPVAEARRLAAGSNPAIDQDELDRLLASAGRKAVDSNTEAAKPQS